MKTDRILSILSACLILLFVYTAVNKMFSIPSLKIVLRDYPFIGGMAPLMSWLLPVVELIVAGLLFLPFSRIIGFYAALVLMIAFTLYVTYMVFFTSHHFCTCGGILQKLSWPEHLIFNLFFLLLSITGIRLYKKGL